MIRKRRNGLQVQVYAGRDPLTGRKRWVSRQVPGQTKRSYREAKKIEAELLEQVDRGQHRGSSSRTVAELIERWLGWRQQVRPISPVTVANYRGAIDRYILPNLGRAKVQQVDASTIDALYEHVRARGGKCRHCWQRVRRAARRCGLVSGIDLGPAPTKWCTSWTASTAGRCRHRRSARSTASCPEPSSRRWCGAGSPTTPSSKLTRPPPARLECAAAQASCCRA